MSVATFDEIASKARGTKALAPRHFIQYGCFASSPAGTEVELSISVFYRHLESELIGRSILKVVGLFAGIGGLELGLGQAGHETLMLCEIWEPARAVLQKHISDVPIEKDVCELGSLPGDTDLLVGGFPCQDLSQAGLTTGINGRRSGLVGEIFRLLDENDVPFVLLENVSFMLRLDRGRAMRVLIEAFEERGYRWAYRVVNTLAFLPQRRERVLFAASKCDIDPGSVLLSDDADPTLPETDLSTRAHGFYWTEGVRGLGWAVDSVPTLKNGSTVGIASPPAILLPNGRVITPDIRDAERLQGFASDWTAPAEAIAKPSIRWSLVGNAVSVPVAHWFGERLREPGEYDADRDMKLEVEKGWPKAARYDGDRRWGVEISAYPVWKTRPSLVEFLNFPGKPLSPRATRGFLSRTERAKLRFPDGFQDRLRSHLADVEGSGPVLEFAIAAE